MSRTKTLAETVGLRGVSKLQAAQSTVNLSSPTLRWNNGWSDLAHLDRRIEDVKLLNLGPNDECSCGSGKKYKKCCRVVVYKQESNALLS